MTTVTETAKRIFREEDEDAIRDGDLARLCSDPGLAQRFAQRLTEVARTISPGTRFSVDDLRDILEVAARGLPQDRARILEGRHFRKRLREQVGLSDRYGEPFACAIVSLAKGLDTDAYQSVLDAVTEGLRSTDMLFLYRHRFALILPRMRVEALSSLVGRIRKLVDVGAGETVLRRIDSMVYPNDQFEDTREVLDWAEDQLRELAVPVS